MKVRLFRKSWLMVLFGPLFGMILAPVLAVPVVILAKQVLGAAGNVALERSFFGAVSLPVIGGLYSIAFVCFGAYFAPS